MKRQIMLNNQPVNYTLRQSGRARRMRLAVYGNGSVVVTMPVGWQEGAAERFVREKTTWILGKVGCF